MEFSGEIIIKKMNEPTIQPKKSYYYNDNNNN